MRLLFIFFSNCISFFSNMLKGDLMSPFDCQKWSKFLWNHKMQWQNYLFFLTFLNIKHLLCLLIIELSSNLMSISLNLLIISINIILTIYCSEFVFSHGSFLSPIIWNTIYDMNFIKVAWWSRSVERFCIWNC